MPKSNQKMTIREYLKSVKKFQKNPKRKKLDRLAYLALGMAGEKGEVIDEVKKLWRNSNGRVTPKRKQKIIHELGDVFNYQFRFMDELGITLPEILEAHIEKLRDRNRPI